MCVFYDLLLTVSIVEYNGLQHYHDVNFFGSFREYQLRDQEKREACSAAGITYVEIPYTWNSKRAPIAATIHKVRPDIPLNCSNEDLHAPVVSMPTNHDCTFHSERLCLCAHSNTNVFINSDASLLVEYKSRSHWVLDV